MIGIDGSSVFGGIRVGLDAEHGSQLLITSRAGSGDHLAVVVVFDDPHWYICVLSARSGKLVSRFRTHFAVSQIYYARLPEGEDCIVAIEGSEEHGAFACTYFNWRGGLLQADEKEQKCVSFLLPLGCQPASVAAAVDSQQGWLALATGSRIGLWRVLSLGPLDHVMDFDLPSRNTEGTKLILNVSELSVGSSFSCVVGVARQTSFKLFSLLVSQKPSHSAGGAIGTCNHETHVVFKGNRDGDMSVVAANEASVVSLQDFHGRGDHQSKVQAQVAKEMLDLRQQHETKDRELLCATAPLGTCVGIAATLAIGNGRRPLQVALDIEVNARHGYVLDSSCECRCNSAVGIQCTEFAYAFIHELVRFTHAAQGIVDIKLRERGAFQITIAVAHSNTIYLYEFTRSATDGRLRLYRADEVRPRGNVKRIEMSGPFLLSWTTRASPKGDETGWCEVFVLPQSSEIRAEHESVALMSLPASIVASSSKPLSRDLGAWVGPSATSCCETGDGGATIAILFESMKSSIVLVRQAPLHTLLQRCAQLESRQDFIVLSRFVDEANRRLFDLESQGAIAKRGNDSGVTFVLRKTRQRMLAAAKIKATRELISCAQRVCGGSITFARFLPGIRAQWSMAQSRPVVGTFAELPQTEIPWPRTSLAFDTDDPHNGDARVAQWTQLLLTEEDDVIDAFDRNDSTFQMKEKGLQCVKGQDATDEETSSKVTVAFKKSASTTSKDVMSYSSTSNSSDSYSLDLPSTFEAARALLMTTAGH